MDTVASPDGKASLPSHRTVRFCIGHSLLLPLSQAAAHRWPTSANLAPTDPELPPDRSPLATPAHTNC